MTFVCSERMQGIDVGAPRRPFAALTPEKEQGIAAVLEKHLAK